jgi:hypothetical protein
MLQSNPQAAIDQLLPLEKKTRQVRIMTGHAHATLD